MEAARLLEEEKKRGAQKRAEGAMKGRQAKQASLCTDSVPSETPPKKRAPRSVDIVAAETGVSRENITLAEKVLQAAPEISKQVEQGDLSLEDAAKKSGVAPKKPTKPRAPKSAKPEAKDRPAKVQSNKSPSVWKDDLVEIPAASANAVFSRLIGFENMVRASNNRMAAFWFSIRLVSFMIGPARLVGTEK